MSDPENLYVLWEASGGVREMHLCPDHYRDLVASLRLSGIGCSAVLRPRPCEVCANNGNWPDLTGRTLADDVAAGLHDQPHP